MAMLPIPATPPQPERPLAPNIELIPPIPPEILSSARSRNLAIFIGAGVSMRMGIPGWDLFASNVLDQLIPIDIINYADFDHLKDIDPRKRLSIAQIFAAQKGFAIDYPLALKRSPSAGATSRIYEYLQRIGCAFVTTNYDDFLDERHPERAEAASTQTESETVTEIRERVFYRPDTFKSVFDIDGGVVHLHGSIRYPETMVVTTSQYLSHYTDSKIIDFIRKFFDRYTVLFVGYGLEETEVLEHILRGSRSGPAKETATVMRQYFMLRGFYSFERRLMSMLFNYYWDTFGVYLVPFLLDKKEYEQLDYVIENWTTEISLRERAALVDDVRAIDEALSE